ncbi:MAG: S-layer homology domain-containing protein [Firmicutes bacterium]|nr:S-layer homology domain-containing protein [Bacillota bacterium]
MKTKKVSKFLILLACCAMMLAFGSASVFAAEPITTAEVTGITVPEIGAYPDFSAAVPENAKYSLGQRFVLGSIDDIFWFEMDGEEKGQMLLMDESKFEKGKTYRLEIILEAKEGYAFVTENFTATLNGFYDLFLTPEDVNTAQNIILCCDFEVGTIGQVFVDELALPLSGRTPDYQVSVPQNALYHVESVYDGWTNGILWTDLTADKTLNPTDTFVEGHRYQVQIDLVKNNDSDLFSKPTLGFINDEIATVNYPWGVRLEMTYTAKNGDKIIDVLSVTDLKTPVAGKKVDYYASIPKDANYHFENTSGDGWINDMIWIDVATNQQLALNDKFEAGRKYELLIGIAPNEGYTFNFDELTGYINGEKAEVFYPPNGAHLHVEYICAPADEKEYTNPFTDVKSTEYYCDPVLWAVDKGITTGTSKDTFSPMDGCTRAQAVTFLWRAAGKPEPKTAVNPFTDVKASDYYYKAVLWAVEHGITNGTTKTTFSPDANCIRPQIVTFLWRFAGEPDPLTAKVPFDDVKADAYFRDAVLWALENEITFGLSKTEFGAEDQCLRGQIVTFLYRYIEE